MCIEKFLKELDRAQKVLKSLEGDFANVRFDPNDPRSINSAILHMEAEIDRRVSYSKKNSLVGELIAGVKSELAEKIRESAAEQGAAARPEKGENNMAESATIFRQIENTVDDLKWAEHNTFARHIKRLSQLLHDEQISEISSNLLAKTNLDEFLDESQKTQGGMVGSAKLIWPDEHKSQLGLMVALIDKMATEDRYADRFSHTFFYDRNFTRCLQNMTGQIIVPFARDFIDYAKTAMGIEELSFVPKRITDPNVRKVFIVHGHDEGAREAVARFLERINFEAIILHEQANKGRTIIEKIEANSDVAFAVILLTPDDIGGQKDGAQQPRARQNVLLELGYFIGHLGRSRVCALKRGEVEIPSDFGGVVYETYDTSGGWKIALAKELEATGFEIDWNKAMAR